MIPLRTSGRNVQSFVLFKFTVSYSNTYTSGLVRSTTARVKLKENTLETDPFNIVVIVKRSAVELLM
jgi:hypothetical protein